MVNLIRKTLLYTIEENALLNNSGCLFIYF